MGQRFLYVTLVLVACIQAVCNTAVEFETFKERGKRRCRSNAHVCTSLIQYPDGSEYDDGPFCACPGCSSSWIMDDFKSLSWPHHERSDKIIQYKFCVPIIPNRICAPGDLAVTVSTETGEWSPHIRDARCACPDHTYQLLGWWKHPMSLYDNSSGLWIYEYFCEKAECSDASLPCAKTYVEKAETGDVSVIGYHFECACPKGYKCPEDDDEQFEEFQKDSKGTFVPKYCELVHKHAVT